jgi:hypothetical protein
MALIDELKQVNNELSKEENSKYYDIARQIVNIERQSYYGNESSSGRLKKIRQIIADAAIKDK